MLPFLVAVALLLLCGVVYFIVLQRRIEKNFRNADALIERIRIQTRQEALQALLKIHNN